MSDLFPAAAALSAAFTAMAALMAGLAWIEAGTEEKLREALSDMPSEMSWRLTRALAKMMLERTSRSREAFTMLARGSAVAAVFAAATAFVVLGLR